MKRLLFFSILIQISIVTSAQSSIIYDKRANQKSEYVFSVGDTIQFFPLNPSFKETYSNKYTCFYDMRCLKHGVKSKYRFATNDGKYTPNDEIEHTYFLVKSINDAKFNEKNKLYFSAILERLEDRTLVYFAFPKDLKKEPKESVLHSWVVADSEGDYIIRKKTALVIPFLTKRVIDKYVTLEGKQLLFRNCYKEGDTESYMLEFANGKALAGDLMDRDCIYEIGHEFITNKFHFIPLGEKLNYSQPVLSISDSIRNKTYEIPVTYFAGNTNRLYVIRGNTPNLLSLYFVDKDSYKAKLQTKDTTQYEHFIGKRFYFDAGYTYETASNFVSDETRSYYNPNYRYRLRKGFYKCVGFDYFQPVSNSNYLNFKKYVVFEDSLEQKFIFPVETDYRQYNVHVKYIKFTEMFELESVKLEKDRKEAENNERLKQFVSKYGEDLGFALWVGKCSEERYKLLCKKYGKRKAGMMARQLYEIGWTYDEFCEAKKPNFKFECVYTYKDGYGYYEIYKYGYSSSKYITFKNSVIISISDYYE